MAKNNSSKLSDEELVKKYLSGDGDSFDELVERYADYIYNFIHQSVSEREWAEDLAQEVFVKVWKNLKKFDTKKKFKVWIFKIARNTIIDFFRKRKEIKFSDLEKKEEEFEIPDTGPIPSEIFEQKEIREEVKKAIDSLPLIYRLVLSSYHQDGFNFREMAEISGVSANTIKSRYRRGLAMLKEKLLERRTKNNN